MLILLSPAKTLDPAPKVPSWHTQPQLLEQSKILLEHLQDFSPEEIGALMKISPKLSKLNFERYQGFSFPFSPQNALPALFTFKGDCYRFPIGEYTADDVRYAQDHLRILSGFYGVLRPMDLIQPYRLEMGTRLQTDRGKTLYDFWGARISQHLSESFASSNEGGENPPLLINLASNEYFKSVKTELLSARIVRPIFKDYRKGEYKLIAIHAKRARGAMTDHLLRSRAVTLDDLKAFTGLGYDFSEEGSTPNEPLFLRRRE